MKTLAVLFAVCIIALTNLNANPVSSVNKTQFTKVSNNFLLGIRYLKLGNTWREAQNYEKAEKALETGYLLILKYADNDFLKKYHMAEYHEYMGYLNRDMNDIAQSRFNFNTAKKIYKSIIKMNDGSQYAIEEVIAKLNSAEAGENIGEVPIPLVKNTNVEDKEQLGRLISDNQRLSEKNRDLKSKIDKLLAEVNFLKNSMRDLEKAIGNLKDKEAIPGY